MFMCWYGWFNDCICYIVILYYELFFSLLFFYENECLVFFGVLFFFFNFWCLNCDWLYDDVRGGGLRIKVRLSYLILRIEMLFDNIKLIVSKKKLVLVFLGVLVFIWVVVGIVNV